MAASLRHITVALLFLIASAIMYHKTVVPWLTPAAITPVALKPDAIVRPVDNLSDLFPDGSWQRGTPTRLQTPDAMLLFEHWEPINDDPESATAGKSGKPTTGWKLWPVTMVIGRGMSSDISPHPIILESAAGAEIRFDGTIDMMAGGAPPIKRGHLMGDVVVRKSGDDRPIRLVTRDVIIDRKKIYTTGSVSLQMGDMRMAGRDLTLHLTSTSALGANGRGKRQTPEPDQLEMIYLDELTLPLEPSNDPAAGGTISVGCGGRVTYDFALSTLEMTDNVRLARTTSGGIVDEFRCENLQLELNRPDDRSQRREGMQDWVRSVTASGAPLVASLPTWDVGIKSNHLKWNANKGNLIASGDRGIEMTRQGIRARMASVSYQYDVAQPEQMGTLVVDGVGIVEMSGDDVPLRMAKWNRRLEIRPMEAQATGMKVVDGDTRLPIEVFVDGGFEASTVDGGSISAETIAGVLVPNPIDASGWLPERFRIQNNIRLDTAQIAVMADQLRLYFVDGPNTASQPRDPARPVSMGQLVQQPAAGEPSQATAPVARNKPIIRGRTINAEVLRSPDGLSARQLSVVDDVEVSHTLLAGGTEMPATLTGQQLQFVNDGGSDVLQLLSTASRPAKLELGDGFFIGPEIQVRPAENLIWINDAGEFRIPSQLLTGVANDDSPSLIAPALPTTAPAYTWTQPPHCRWRGEMLFDGSKAKLDGGVDIDAEFVREGNTWELALRGEALTVDLSQPVDLRRVETVRSAAVANLTLVGSQQRPVMAEAIGRDAKQSMMSRSVFHAETLRLQPAQLSTGGSTSSMLVGSGPGWFRGWMLGSRSGDSIVDDRTMVDSAASELTAVHLIYQGAMSANLSDRDLRFETGIRVAMQPVNSWDTVLDAGLIENPAIGVSVLDCDNLRMSADPSALASMGQSAAAWEIQADGGVRFQVRGDKGLLKGTTATAFYSTRKDLFTTRGLPGRPATVQVVRPDGSPGISSTIEVLAVHPKTMQFKKLVPKRINMTASPDSLGR